MIKYIMIEINGKDIKFSSEEAEKLYHELDKIYGNTGYPLPIQPVPYDPYYPYPITTSDVWIGEISGTSFTDANIPITYTY